MKAVRFLTITSVFIFAGILGYSEEYGKNNTILLENADSIVIYLYPFNHDTRIPLDESLLKRLYLSKIIIEKPMIESISSQLANMIDATAILQQKNLRMLIDITWSTHTASYFIPMAASENDGMRRMIGDFFFQLSGIRQ